jgi:hypothetical protein
MAKTRIKKPVRKKKKSDYPGEMSFRKALGMNPTYYQEGGKLYYQQDVGLLPPKYVDNKDDPAFIAYKDSFDLARLSQIQQEREGFNRFIPLSSIGDESQKHAAKERSNKGVNPSTPQIYDKNNDEYNYYKDKLSSLNNPRIFLSPRSSTEFYHSSIFPTKGIVSKRGPLNAYYPSPKQRVLVKPNEGITRNIHQYPFRHPVTGKTEDRVSLITPAHQYIMNMNQYGKLGPTDSIPQQGNFLYRTNRQDGGKLYYQQDNNIIPSKFNPQMFQPNEVKYGTPEYEQAYNQGTLTTRLSGDAENAPLRARMLPEFKVTPEYKSLSDELRRAAILGTKEAAELTGIPGTIKFARNPRQSLKGTGNTIVDLGLMAGAGLSPVGRFGQMNPMGGMQYATQGINPLTGEGSFRAEDVEGAFNTLDAVGTATTAGAILKAPVTAGIKQAGRYATTQTPLRNAYNLNPKALKENPEMFLYRTQPKDFVAGYTEQQFLEDLITDKTLKGEKVPYYLQNKLNKIKYEPEPFRKALDEYHGQWFDKNPSRMDFYMKGRLDGDEGNILRLKVPKKEGMAYNLENFPEAKKASLNYDTEFIVPKDKLNQAEAFSTNDWQQLIQDDKAFNTPHWLKGYPQVEVPRQLPGSPNAGKSFKSEIDWRNWIKYKEDFDNNPQVIQELIDIEKTSKANGTWMKNPDGSPFQGSPEQFVVQQSSKFKDAYKEGFETVWRGGDRKPELNTKYSSEGDVVFTTKDEYGGHAYNRADNPHIKLSDTDTPPEGLSKLYAPKTKNKIVIDGDNSYMSEGRLIKNDRLRKEYGRLNVIDQNPSTPLEKENLNTFINWMKVNRPGVDLKDRVMTDNFASFLNSPQGRNIDRVEFKKIYDGTEFPINVEVHNLNNKKQLKSMFGNILFDMSNPNKHKSLAPYIGTGAAGTYGANQLMNQQQQQMRRQGGKLYYQEDVGPLPTLYVDPNNPEGVSRYEAYQDSTSKFKKGDRNYLTRMSYGPAGLQRPYWRKTRTVDLPPGYIVPNQTNQPIGRKITEASFPQLIDPVTKQRFGKEYFRKVLDIYAEPRQPVEYLSKSNNTSTVNKPSNSVSAPVRNFRETISQVPYRNPMTGDTEPRVVLRTPKDEFMMNLEQYGKLGLDSIPKEGNYMFKKSIYARGGSLTSAQDTAQAADLNKDVMRKDIKKASVGEDFMAGLYGVGEGLVDTLTFGLTDELTDAGFKALQAGAGHDVNSVEAKRQAGIKGWGNVGGAVTGAFINPASAFSAGQEGLEGIGQGIQGINPEDKTLQAVGKGVEGLGNIQLPKGMESMEGMSKLFMARNGGKFKYGYRGGGHMLNQNMGLTEIDGPSHEEGGVTLPNSGGRPDVEVEGPETIYTPENYVMSEKMKASLEALEFAGITGKSAKSLAGKSYADLSKMVKSKAGDKLRPNDPLSKKMLDKEMKRLMRAHEYDREAKRMQDEAMRTQMMGGSNVVAETPEQRAGGYNMYPNAQSIEFPGSGQTSVVPTYNNDPIMVTGADGSQQMLTDEPIETEAPFIEEKMAQGGKMIKRADGSYSRRGLWDNIRANRGSGKKPTKQMLEQEAKIKAAEKAYGGYYADGGSFNNPGFRALPSYVQAKIKSNMALGGDMAGLGMEDESLMQGASSFLNPITQTLNNVADIESQENEYQMQLGGYMGDYISDDDTMEYGQGGYTVRKSNDRKGKTHVVTGPDGTKKYFGDPKLGERGKSKYGKDAFYARHKKNLDKNPYFRAYARATWEDGGYMNMLNSNVDMADMQAPMYAYGGSMKKMGNFAPMNSGYMYQMGGEMMQAPQQGQPQGQPQGGGGEEQILQQVAQMLQQGMSPEEIVGQLVQMGVPQEQAIQVVQMVVQQMQGQQQAPQQEPQQAPPMMRGGGYMYQMGGEMAPQQAPQQQAQGGEEQIVQAIMQMLQQGMQPEEIVGELVKMGLPQEAAIQAVQMVMQQSQQGQQGQQQQMPTEAPAPMMRYGGRVTKQMGGSLADNYLSQVNQYPVLKRNGGKLYYQEKIGLLPIPEVVDNPEFSLPSLMNNELELTGLKSPEISPELEYKTFPVGKPKSTPPPLPNYESPMGNYIAGGLGSMFGPLANAAAAAFAPDPTYTAAPKFKKFDYTPVALQRAAGNQAMANTRQAIRMGAPTQGSYLANVGVAMPSAGAQIGTQLAQTRYGIDSQNIGLINQESQLRAAQAEKNALMKDQSISNRWKLGMEAAAGTGRNIQGFSKDMGAKGMQDQLLNQLRTGDFAVIGYDNVNGTLVPKLAPAGVATYNDGSYTAPNGKRFKWNPETENFEPIKQ